MKLIHLDAKNIVRFTQNLMQNSMSLVPVSKNNWKWLRIWKKNNVWKAYIYVIRGLVHWRLKVWPKKKKKIELLQKFLEKLQKFEYSFLVRWHHRKYQFFYNETMLLKYEQEVGDDFSFCVLNLLPEVNTLSSLVAISLWKWRYKFLKLSRHLTLV